MRQIEAPTVTKKPGHGGMGEEVTRHPAFAQIAASRVSGRTALYDSDFDHNAYMTIAIRRSELHRSLANDWHFGREELIHVAMSEAQWATFVSSPNMGSGVPCTIQYVAGELVPGLPPPQPRAKQFHRELTDAVAASVEAIAALEKAIDQLGLSKAKMTAVRDLLHIARARINSTAPFIAEQFEEHMEKTVERAKAEIHGYMNGALVRNGLTNIGAEVPLQLPSPEE